MTLVYIVIALVVLAPCSFAITRAQRRLKEWGVPRAVEIARYQEWVSTYRLMNQAHLTKSDAQLVLREARRQGRLYQAVNGRYYIAVSPAPAPPFITKNEWWSKLNDRQEPRQPTAWNTLTPSPPPHLEPKPSISPADRQQPRQPTAWNTLTPSPPPHLEPKPSVSPADRQQPRQPTAWNTVVPAVPLVAKNEWWSKLDEAFDSLAAAFAKNPIFHLAKTYDQMDDHVIITLAAKASIVECEDKKVSPTLMFCIHRNLVSLHCEIFIFVKEKYFSRKGKNIELRLRFDEAAAVVFKCSGSTNYSSVFFVLGEIEPLLKLATTDRLRLQITTEHGGPVFAIFDIYAARPAFDLFFKGLLGPDFKEICSANPQIVNFVLRLGPKNTMFKKRALAELGFYDGPIDTTKPGALFQAISRYAEARGASELSSTFEPGKTKFNLPWYVTLHTEASPALRKEMGSLKIFD